MQVLKKCISLICNNAISNSIVSKCLVPRSSIHTSCSWNGTEKWMKQNEFIYPPQDPSEPRRPAFVVNVRENIKYSPKTMWYIACLVRGLSVEEAIKQLSFCLKKGAVAAKETILEAQKMAVEQHNVEFKTNLWVSESFATRGKIIKGARRHAKGRIGVIFYRYVHYYVKLEEGKPPAHYYLPEPKSKEELIENWVERMRQRRIINSL